MEDFPAILRMIEQHEGPESARIAHFWIERQPRAFTVFRTGADPHMGFCANLVLSQPNSEEIAADPAIAAVWEYVRRYGPLRPGEHILHHRFWSGREVHQDIAATQNLIAVVTSSLWISSPHLAWAFLVIANPELYRPMFTYINMRYATEAGFAVGGKSYAIFAHDWRAEPPLAWLDHVSDRELDHDIRWEDLEANFSPPLVVLSQPDFEEAVRQALRDYSRPALLAGNPLLHSRLADSHPGAPPVDALRALLLDVVSSLKGSHKEEKLYRALWVTYIEPAPTQEAAAERLDLPFSTYRYHLTAGLEKVTAALWQRELYGES